MNLKANALAKIKGLLIFSLLTFLCITISFTSVSSKEKVHIIVKIGEQRLYLLKGDTVIKEYPISTSKYGIGSKEGSYKTPIGLHKISRKIGGGAQIGTIFIGGKNMGRIASIYRDKRRSVKDLVLTRILWLEGLEPGVNKGLGVDSFKRRIYIHGTQEEGYIGQPASMGCIRMKNRDVVELFDMVNEGTLVEIQP